MGQDRPVAWYRRVGEGLTFYTSPEHTAETWEQDALVRMVKRVVDLPRPIRSE